MSDFPRTQDEWYMAGLIYGWSAPQCTREAPAPLNEELLNAYFQGVEDGGNARLEYEETRSEEGEPTPDYPTIGPVPGGGVSLEKYEERQREILEGLFHQHMPHVDLPEYEPWYPPLGGMVQQPVP